MKFYVMAALAGNASLPHDALSRLWLTIYPALSGVHATASASTTITCPGCPLAVATPDIVTRSALPTMSCSEKPLTAVSGTWASSGVAAPTGSDAAPTPSAQVPVSGASMNKMGNIGGVAVVAAVAAVYML
ncbi:hypothetical protein F66182_10480 [Fusarium sp. NRRL 66182]|nr:hypothetical protein F66182_10480 [Fusarium sp. NRRL 66182]